MIIYIVLLLLLVIIFYSRKNYVYWKNKKVLFDPPFLFFGSLFNVVVQKESIFERLRAIYLQHNTPYVGMHLFTIPFLMLRDPKMIKTVLVKDFDKFMNRGTVANEAVDPIAFHSLFSAEGETWRGLRHKLSPIFSAGKIKLMFPIMEECGKNLNKYLTNHDGQVIEVRNIMKRYTVDVISSCAFGVDANCWIDEDSDMIEMATKLADFSFDNVFKLTLFDPSATKFLLDVFRTSLKTRGEMKIVRNDFIDLLNNLKKDELFTDSYKFNDVKMAAQAIFFFVAGNDTSTVTMIFTLYELSLNKDMQNKLREEVKDTFGDDEDLSYEHVQQMKYMDMIICETLRKYPVIAFLNRKSVEKYTFEETGLTLEENTDVLIPIFGLHYDPEYFPEPEKFIPERFSEENRKNIQPYVYLPFGEGPRYCIGQRFGLLSVKLGLAYIIKDFDFDMSDKDNFSFKYDPKAFLLQSKESIHLKVTKI